MIFKLLRGHGRKRSLITLFLMLSAAGLMPSQALALSAGRIQVNSFLNEPFRAQVNLSSLQPGEVEQLRVRLADDEAYASLGVEKSRFLTSLQFNVREGSEPGSAVVSISSRQVAKEPFFSFLLEFRGLGGRLIREYTVLLDPNTGQRQRAAETRVAPLTPASSTVSIPPPVRSTPAPRPVAAAPAPVRSAARATARPAPPAPVARVDVPSPLVFESNQPILRGEPLEPGGQSSYGPVRAGITLWQIAEAVRPAPDLSMNQVMWALYAANEDQFDGNLNLVRKGAMLSVPSAQAIRDVSPGEAAALVADQREQHQQRLQQLAAAQTGGSRASEPQQVALESARPSATPRPRVTPAPTPLPATPVPATPVPATPQPIAETLGDEPEFEELPLAEEADSELGYEDETADAPAIPEPEAPPVEIVEELAMVEDDAIERFSEEADGSFEGETEFADLPALPGDDELAADSGFEQSLPSDEQSQSSGLLPWLLGALGLLAVAVLALFRLRRKPQESGSSQAPVSDFQTPATAGGAATSDVTTKEFPAVDVADAPAAAGAESTLEATGDFSSDGGMHEETDFDLPDLDTLAQQDDAAADFDATGELAADDTHSVDFGDTEVAVAATPSAPEEDMTLDLPAVEPAPADDLGGVTETLDLGSETVSLELNEDPVSEADFQLAYGLYDEAALLLNRAIEADPDRLELHEKLAETYFAAGNAESFQQAAQALQQRNPDAETWQRIAIMGQQLCPGDALFAGDLDGAAGGVDLDMDFDSGDEPDAAGASLDFTMDDGAAPSDASDEPATDSAEAADGDAHVLEFELDEPPAAEPAAPQQAAEAAADDDDFDADFGDLELADGADDDLPELDDLDLGDLEAEFDADTDGETAEDSSGIEQAADDSLSGDTVMMQAAEIAAEEPAADGDFADLTLSDISDTELGLDTEHDAGDVLGSGTDFDLDQGDDALSMEPLSEDATADSAELSLADGDATDFDLDDLGAADEGASDSDFELDAAAEDDGLSLQDDSAGPGSEPVEEAHASVDSEFDLAALGDDAENVSNELDLGDLELDSPTTERADEGAATDFDLDALGGEAEATDFDLGDLESDATADAAQATDFDLSDLDMDADAQATDFDLDNLGADDGQSEELELTLDADDSSGLKTDFDLDNPVGESAETALTDETDFELDDVGGVTDLDLDAGTDAGDISGGDEAGTKLDLARAYVDMGEADMARSLLDEVIQGGNEAQQQEAQELLGKL